MIALAGRAVHVLVFHVPTLHGGRAEYRSNSLDQLAPPPNTPTGGGFSVLMAVTLQTSGLPHLTSPHSEHTHQSPHQRQQLLIILIDINQIKSISSYILIDCNLVSWLLMFLYRVPAWYMIWFSIFIWLEGHFGYSCHYFNVMPISFVCHSLDRRSYSWHSG